MLKIKEFIDKLNSEEVRDFGVYECYMILNDKKYRINPVYHYEEENDVVCLLEVETELGLEDVVDYFGLTNVINAEYELKKVD